MYSPDGSDVAEEAMACQQQANASDCGIFVIAFAIELLQGGDLSTIEFDTTQMRPHLKCCFLNQELTSFPKIQVSNGGLEVAKTSDFWSKLAIKGKLSLADGQWLTDDIMDSVSDILKKQRPEFNHSLLT